MTGTYLDQLSWPEAETALSADPVILIPLGARLKEHGYHLPLNNDWLLARYFCRRVMEQANVLVTPTVQFSFFPAFVDYPGSVNINRDTAGQLLNDLISSLARHGGKRFYVLNTGISTNWVLEPLRLKLAEQQVSMTYLDLLEALPEIEQQVAEQSCGSHADEIETSMMLYIQPEVVRVERAVDASTPYQAGPFRRDPTQTGLYSPSGAWGDPTLATWEKGEFVVEKLVGAILDEINDFSSEDWQPQTANKRYLE